MIGYLKMGRVRGLLYGGVLAVLVASAGVASLVWVSHAHAALVLGATRVVYDAGAAEATVKLSNHGEKPGLAQVWIDRGDPAAAPDKVQVPFTIIPPVVRIEPGKAQTLRILGTGEPMPADRESVFWLNMLDVPPKPTGALAEVNRLQIAVRTRIKVFYRPAGLKGTAHDAPAQITWKWMRQGSDVSLAATNPTPFHVSLTRFRVEGAGKRADGTSSVMIAPGETKVLEVAGDVAGDVVTDADARVIYQGINDNGGDIEGSAPIRLAR